MIDQVTDGMTLLFLHGETVKLWKERCKANHPSTAATATLGRAYARAIAYQTNPTCEPVFPTSSDPRPDYYRFKS